MIAELAQLGAAWALRSRSPRTWALIQHHPGCMLHLEGGEVLSKDGLSHVAGKFGSSAG